MSNSVDIFTQVKFLDVHEYYYNLKDVECQFTVSPVLKPDPNDIIGIYKVGWKTTKDALCSKAVNVLPDVMPETGLDSCIIFSGDQLNVCAH
jgi:hypothetical protein